MQVQKIFPLQKKRGFYRFATLVLGSWAVLSGCGQQEKWENECAHLLEQRSGLQQRRCQLDARVDSLWDATSEQLMRVLPASFPAADREIYLKSRNADHIKMFMSFHTLDSSTQRLVNNAGVYDAALATQIRDWMGEYQAFEQQKIQFLKQVDQHDTEVGRGYATLLRRSVQDTCR